jgi:lysophospholipase L1-like esterase
MARSDPKTPRLEVIAMIVALLQASTTLSRRIAMLGDSITEGYGTSKPIYSWPHMLQKALQLAYKIAGLDEFAFEWVSANYAFQVPNRITSSAQASGTEANDTRWGSMRRGNTQQPGSKRWWTVRFSSADVVIRRTAATDAYIIRVDGVIVANVTSGAPGTYRHNTGAQAFSSTSPARKIEVEFVKGVPVFAGFAFYRGSETKSVQVWEMGKSNTAMSQFTAASANTVQGVVAGWRELLKSVNPHIVFINWLTNDASSFKLTAAQCEANWREIVAMVRAELPNAIIILSPPQPKFEGTVKLVEPWENYIDAASRVVRDNPNMLLDPMSDYVKLISGSSIYMSDGVHPNDLGYARYADNTAKTITGVRDLGNTGTTPPPTGGSDTVGPVIEWISPAIGGVLSGTVPFRAKVTDATGVGFQAVYTGPDTRLGIPQLIDASQNIWGFDLDVTKLTSFSGARWVARDKVGTTGNPTSTPTRAMTWTAPATTEPDPGEGTTPPPTGTVPPPNNGSYPPEQQFMMQSDWVGAFVRIGQGPLTPQQVDPKFDYAAANHTATLNLMAAQLKAAGGRGEGYLPAGVYNTSSLDFDYSSLPVQPDSGAPYGYSGAKVFGAGKRQTVLRQIAGSTGNVLRVSGRKGSEAGPGNNNKVSGFHLSDLQIIGASTGGHALNLEGLVGCTFRELHISEAGKSGVYLERSVFDPDAQPAADDAYFFQNEFAGITLVRNKWAGMESDGLAAVSLLGTNIEATQNGRDGIKLAGSSVVLVNPIVIGNGSGDAQYRGIRFMRNGNLRSSVGNVTLLGGRAEGNGAAGGYELEIDSGTGFMLSNFFALATAGAHGIGIGLRGYGDAGAVFGAKILGGSVRGVNGAAQKAFVLGADSRQTKIDTRMDFDSFVNNGTIASMVTDNGQGTSWDLARSSRTRLDGSTEVMGAGAGMVLHSPDGTAYKVAVPNGGASLAITVA